MTDRLEEAFAKTTRLPDNEQDAGERQLFLPVAEDGIGRFMGDGGSV